MVVFVNFQFIMFCTPSKTLKQMCIVLVYGSSNGLKLLFKKEETLEAGRSRRARGTPTPKLVWRERESFLNLGEQSYIYIKAESLSEVP